MVVERSVWIQTIPMVLNRSEGCEGCGCVKSNIFQKEKKQVSQVPDKDGKTRRGIDCGETMVGFVLNTLTLSF